MNKNDNINLRRIIFTAEEGFVEIFLFFISGGYFAIVFVGCSYAF